MKITKKQLKAMLLEELEHVKENDGTEELRKNVENPRPPRGRRDVEEPGEPAIGDNRLMRKRKGKWPDGPRRGELEEHNPLTRSNLRQMVMEELALLREENEKEPTKWQLGGPKTAPGAHPWIHRRFLGDPSLAMYMSPTTRPAALTKSSTASAG